MGKLVRFQYSAATVSPDSPTGVEGTSPNTNHFKLSRAGKPSYIFNYSKDLKFCTAGFFLCPNKMFKSKNQKIISSLVLILIILAGAFFLIAHKKTENLLPPPFSSPYVGGGRVGVNENNITFTNDILGKTSVYDFMSELRNEGKINFVEKNYICMGEMIAEINGIKNNSGQSWIYYVNGKEASVGVSNYKIKSGDTVSWKYEKSNY